jgi:hypothetical protein
MVNYVDPSKLNSCSPLLFLKVASKIPTDALLSPVVEGGSEEKHRWRALVEESLQPEHWKMVLGASSWQF